jgi:hypothetical protein
MNTTTSLKPTAKLKDELINVTAYEAAENTVSSPKRAALHKFVVIYKSLALIRTIL